MTPDAVLDRIDRLFADRGSQAYHGEAVSQLEHALQAALAGEEEGAPPELIAAALLHDLGHLLSPHGEDAVERGIDDRHEALGQRFLAKHFGPAVTEPVRLHVEAKRYLCAVDPEYRAKLSPASEQSLRLQGGPMTPAEVAEYERGPFAAAAARVRRWDDVAKVPGLPTPPLAHFREYLAAAVRPAD
jgi:[1-hydroxy-2-(trimethylamino)ethyl]phosphonate dioxygenase